VALLQKKRLYYILIFVIEIYQLNHVFLKSVRKAGQDHQEWKSRSSSDGNGPFSYQEKCQEDPELHLRVQRVAGQPGLKEKQ